MLIGQDPHTVKNCVGQKAVHTQALLVDTGIKHI